MKKLIVIGCFALFTLNIGLTNSFAQSDNDKSFDSYKERFVEQLWKVYPQWASGVGYHKYDSIIIVLSEERFKEEKAFANGTLDSLKKFPVEKLSPNNRIDLKLIENQMKAILWSIDDFKSYEWNPASYNVGEGFADILTGKFSNLEARLRDLSKRMDKVPAYYEAAKKFIKNPTKEHTQLGIDQNKGSVSVFDEMLKDSVNASKLSEQEKQEMLVKIELCKRVINDYVSWLSALDKNSRSFRIGQRLYSKKFEYDIESRYTAAEIYQKALKRKEELHSEMEKLTKQMWPKYFADQQMPQNRLEAIKMMIGKLSLVHVKPEEFQTAIEAQIPELVEFIKKKDLIYIDPSKPLVVRKEPAYMAGVAGASISAPGPYDKGGNTYYNVGSMAAYSPEAAESFLREYNQYILQILNIHEAIPGHYTQLVYSNQSPSIIKSIFGNGAMVEGWAVYTERMMLEEGYGNNEPEMWLMYYKWHLRTVCNTILDYSIHNLNLSENEALDLLMNQAFQEKTEAKGKWKRATLSQVQLCSYFTGYTEIFELREEIKKLQGKDFNLKRFHEKFLSYGSSPVKYIRELMLADLKK